MKRLGLVVAACMAGVFGMAVAYAATSESVLNTSWKCSGKVKASLSIKGGGTVKGEALFSNAILDLLAGSAILGDMTLPFGATASATVTDGSVRLDPTYKNRNAKLKMTAATSTVAIGDFLVDVYDAMATTGTATIVSGPALMLGQNLKAVAADLGNLDIDKSSIKASGKFNAKKGLETGKGAITISFKGTMKSGKFNGKAVKGKVQIQKIAGTRTSSTSLTLDD